MSQKHFWAWTVVVSIGLMIIGSILVIFLEPLGLGLIAIGGILFVVAGIALIVLLIKERSRDNEQMVADIDEEDLRP